MNSISTNLVASSMPEPGTDAAELLLKLKSTPEKNQLPLIQEFGNLGETGLKALMAFLQERCTTRLDTDLNDAAAIPRADIAAGKTYQLLLQANSPAITEFLQTHFPAGVLPLRSPSAIDYQPLQQLLAQQNFEAADQVTLQLLCALAGPAAVQRKWVYFTDVEQFAIADLQTINALWLTYSEGKFGFSVQRELWLSVGKNWEKLWSKIAWKDGNNWTRYPNGFTWNLTAPRGHLPLSNQLRGVRTIASLLAHPAWNPE